jgi:SAM-dependent methyltransferase
MIGVSKSSAIGGCSSDAGDALYLGLSLPLIEKNTEMENWIPDQVARNSRSFEAAMLSAHPEARAYVLDPEKYFERVCEECNYLDAAKVIEWTAAFPPTARVLDLGGGTGWLSAYLSTLSNVAEITIVDSSRAYLETNLAVSVARLGGDLRKIKSVVGYFSPLLVPDSSLDVVVSSASLHHAESLEGVLREVRRVLVPGGKCFVLNEIPVRMSLYLRVMLVASARTLGRTLLRRYTEMSPSVSASGILYDPLLGDRMYPLWYWHEGIRRAGLELHETIDSGLPIVKGGRCREGTLVHFACSKARGLRE